MRILKGIAVIAVAMFTGNNSAARTLRADFGPQVPRESPLEVRELNEKELVRDLEEAIRQMEEGAAVSKLFRRKLSFLSIQGQSPQRRPEAYKISWPADELRRLANSKRSLRRSIRASYLAKESGERREFVVAVRVVPQRLVWVARHPLVRQRLLRSKDFVRSWRTVNSLNSSKEGIIDWNLISDHVLKRGLRAGETLRARDIIARSSVDRNQTLRMVLRRGGVRVHATVRALESGSVGDVIRVMCTQTRKRMRARVLAGQRLEALW